MCHWPYPNHLSSEGSALHSLSPPETKTMEKYINDSLMAGIIQSSSSPATAGFLWRKEGHISMTMHQLQRTQMTSLSKTGTHSSHLHFNDYKELLSLLNWISGMCIILRESGRETNGRLPLLLLVDNMSTWLCLLGSPTFLHPSRVWSMTCYEICSMLVFLCTWMALFFSSQYRSMFCMYIESCSNSRGTFSSYCKGREVWVPYLRSVLPWTCPQQK